MAAALWAAAACSGPSTQSTSTELQAAYTEFEQQLQEIIGEVRAGELEATFDRLRAAYSEPDRRWQDAYFLGFATLFDRREGAREEALRLIAEAEKLAQADDDSIGIAESNILLARRAPTIEESYQRFLIASENARAAGEAGLATFRSAVFQISTIERSRGQFVEAINWLDQITPGLQESNLSVYIDTLYEYAYSYRMLGDFDRARSIADEGAALAASSGSTGQRALAEQLLGFIHLDINPADATTHFQNAIEAAEEIEAFGFANHVRMAIGLTDFYLGKHEKARQRFQSTLATSLEQGESDPDMRIGAISNLLYLADAERLTGDLDEAQRLYQQTRELADRWNQREYTWRASGGLAANALAAGQVESAIAEARRSIDEIESMRRAVPNEEQRVYFLRSRQNVYATLALAQLRRDGDEASSAFATIEQVHARTLRESLSSTDPSENGEISASIDAIQARLKPGEVVVEYLLGEQESMVIAVTADATRADTLPGRESIEELVRRYRMVLQRPQISAESRLNPEKDFRMFAESGRTLATTLLGPVADLIQNASRIILVPDKQLHRLSFVYWGEALSHKVHP